MHKADLLIFLTSLLRELPQHISKVLFPYLCFPNHLSVLGSDSGLLFWDTCAHTHIWQTVSNIKSMCNSHEVVLFPLSFQEINTLKDTLYSQTSNSTFFYPLLILVFIWGSRGIHCPKRGLAQMFKEIKQKVLFTWYFLHDDCKCQFYTLQLL